MLLQVENKIVTMLTHPEAVQCIRGVPSCSFFAILSYDDWYLYTLDHLSLTIDKLSIQGCKRSHPYLEGAERRPHCTQVRFFGL